VGAGVAGAHAEGGSIGGGYIAGAHLQVSSLGAETRINEKCDSISPALGTNAAGTLSMTHWKPLLTACAETPFVRTLASWQYMTAILGSGLKAPLLCALCYNIRVQ
jgi:hypothetical protein